ncbi:MAG: cell wall hydrolase [Fastidiosipilaceae bacterium]
MSNPEIDRTSDSDLHSEQLDLKQTSTLRDNAPGSFHLSRRSASKVVTTLLAFSVVGMVSEFGKDEKTVNALTMSDQNLPKSITVFEDAAIGALEEAVANRKMTIKKAEKLKTVIIPNDIKRPADLTIAKVETTESVDDPIAADPAQTMEIKSLVAKPISTAPVATFVDNQLVLTTEANEQADSQEEVKLDDSILDAAGATDPSEAKSDEDQTDTSSAPTDNPEKETESTVTGSSAEKSDESEQDNETDDSKTDAQVKDQQVKDQTKKSSADSPSEKTSTEKNLSKKSSEDALSELAPANGLLSEKTADEKTEAGAQSTLPMISEPLKQTSVMSEVEDTTVTSGEDTSNAESESAAETEEEEFAIFLQDIKDGAAANKEAAKPVEPQATQVKTQASLGADIEAAIEAKEISEQHDAELAAIISNAAKEAAEKAEEAEKEAARIAEEAEMRKYAIEASDEDRQLFYGIMAAECGSWWDYDGCLMIAQTVTNRVRNSGGTLRGVLTAPGQFTTYSNGMWQTRTPTAAQRQAADDALAGKRIIANDVTYFCTNASYRRSSWFQSLDHRHTYDNTEFFATW